MFLFAPCVLIAEETSFFRDVMAVHAGPHPTESTGGVLLPTAGWATDYLIIETSP